MSRFFNIKAREVCNLLLPLHRRYSSLRHCMDYMTNLRFSFQALEDALTVKFGITWNDLPLYLGTEQQLSDAVAFLEVKHNIKLEQLCNFERKRIREKAHGKRQPSRVDLESLFAPDPLPVSEN